MSQAGPADPPRFSTLIVAGAANIETAAFTVEQVERIREAVGPVEAFVGFDPWRVRYSPPPADAQRYSTSHYWKAFGRIPHAVEWARPGIALYLATAVRTVFSTGLALAGAAWRMVAKRSGRAFFDSIKHQDLRGIPAGAPILSDYLRSDRSSRGYLRFDAAFIRTLCACHFHVHYWTDVRRDLDFSRILFSQPETTYRAEAVRRVLLRRGASEVYCDRWDAGRLRVSNSHTEGRVTMLRAPVRKSLSQAELDAARAWMARRLEGTATYPYMGADVDAKVMPHFAAGIDPARALRPPRAVLFMHAVADAQHFFGPDCFVDLHHWLETSIDLLLKNGYSVYLKLHPCYFDTDIKRAADRRYRAYLEGRLGASWDRVAPGEIAPTRAHPGLFIVDYRVDVRSLQSSLGEFLGVTHHGTIATEATALGIPVVCSVANAFRHFPAFAWQYDSVDRYEALLRDFAAGRLHVDESRMRNLYLYLHETRDDNWMWMFKEYTRLCGHNFVEEPAKFSEFLLSVDPSADPGLYMQVKNVFACRQPEDSPGDTGRRVSAAS